MNKQHRRSGAEKLLLGLLVIVIAVGGVLLWVRHHDKKNLNLATSKSSQNPVKGATSKPTPHQATTTNSNPTGQGGVVDKNGQTSGSLPPSSQWVASASGNITLQQPSPNTTVKSGDTLSGLAKVSSVQFILTDNSVGLIAQGNLNVVNGKFSGTLQFTPHAGSGKLEVYYPNPANGAEEDIITIDVNLST
jgi:hypothetical protein